MIKWIKNALVAFIARHLPNKGKRAFYILICYLSWSKITDKEELKLKISGLNKELGLVDNQDALNFVIEIKDALMDIDDFKPLKEIDPSKASTDDVNKCMPNYIRYNSDGINEVEFHSLVVAAS